MLETAALAAEALGDDELAEFYVDKGIERYAGCQGGRKSYQNTSTTGGGK